MKTVFADARRPAGERRQAVDRDRAGTGEALLGPVRQQGAATPEIENLAREIDTTEAELSLARRREPVEAPAVGEGRVAQNRLEAPQHAPDQPPALFGSTARPGALRDRRMGDAVDLVGTARDALDEQRSLPRIARKLGRRGRLLAGGAADRRHDRVDVAHDPERVVDDVRRALGGLRQPVDPLADVADGFADLDRQGFHFMGHHAEAAAGLAGPRRLDRRVERQQVGLAGDLRDRIDDAADFSGRDGKPVEHDRGFAGADGGGIEPVAHAHHRLVDLLGRL